MTPGSTPPPTEAQELVELAPAARWREESARDAARADDRYWDAMYDRDED